jgi:hypothetical protein
MARHIIKLSGDSVRKKGKPKDGSSYGVWVRALHLFTALVALLITYDDFLYDERKIMIPCYVYMHERGEYLRFIFFF